MSALVCYLASLQQIDEFLVYAYLKLDLLLIQYHFGAFMVHLN